MCLKNKIADWGLGFVIWLGSIIIFLKYIILPSIYIIFLTKKTPFNEISLMDLATIKGYLDLVILPPAGFWWVWGSVTIIYYIIKFIPRFLDNNNIKGFVQECHDRKLELRMIELLEKKVELEKIKEEQQRIPPHASKKHHKP